MITINVTNKHYSEGCRKDPLKCAVALALKEKTHVEWMVNDRSIITENITLLLPDHVRVVINEFDNNILPNEVNFSLPLIISENKVIIDEENYSKYVQSLKNDRESITSE